MDAKNAGALTEQGEPARILLIDDHPIVRRGVAQLLRDDGFHVGAAVASLGQARQELSQQPFDAIIVDLSLEEESGLELVSSLGRKKDPTPTIVYSVHEEGAFLRKAFQVGARGYVTKREDPETLIACLRKVLQGDLAPSPRAAQILKAHQNGATSHRLKDTLSLRELSVYQLMGEGLDTPDIAARLSLSVRTVETYYDRITRKLNINGRRDLRRLAVQDAHVGTPTGED